MLIYFIHGGCGAVKGFGPESIQYLQLAFSANLVTITVLFGFIPVRWTHDTVPPVMKISCLFNKKDAVLHSATATYSRLLAH
mmetsp:Transcript_16564/g.20461  ORF Transcript_16564/g.20461 Transcript_16564/m.20461 type:complete len:82 (-) Transcript_16564:1051-1296(-)